MKMTDKLTMLMSERGVSRREFSNQSGIPYMTIVNFYENGTENVKLSTLKKIASFFNTSLDYIADDSIEAKEPTRFVETVSGVELSRIKKYRTLDEHGKEMVDIVLEKECARIEGMREDTFSDSACIIKIPLPLQYASAGTGELADDDTADCIPVLRNVFTEKADYAMRVHGDSMEPKIHNGDLLLVRSQPAVELGETGVFIRDGDRYVKVYRGKYLESLNPKYDDVPLEEYSRCIGKVIGVLDPQWIAQ